MLWWNLFALFVIAATLVQSSRGSCDSIVVNSNAWPGNLGATLRIPVARSISTYTITITTNIPLTRIVFWAGDVTPTTGSKFTLRPKSWFSGANANTILDLGFQISFSGSTVPTFTSIQLNDGQSVTDLCSGSVGTTTKTTTTTTTTTTSTITTVPGNPSGVGCSSVLVDKTAWSGAMQATLRIPITSSISTYTVQMTTDLPLTGIQFWTANVSPTTGISFTLTPKSWYGGQAANTNLDLGFQIFYSGSVEPTFTAITINFGGSQRTVCQGSSLGITTTTAKTTTTTIKTTATTAKPATTTAKPTITTAKPAATTTTTVRPSTTSPVSGAYNYGEVIRLSLLFYEAQRSGKLPSSNRIPWRGDSSVNDRGNNGEDLSGGYHDAGDYVKFGLPFSGAMTVLAWGGLTFKDAYSKAGQLEYLKDAIRWGTDYMLKAHVSANSFYCQVGNGDIDHAYPGRPEDMTVSRPAYKLDSTHPGSDCAGESAAALAAASILLSDNATYSALLLKHAEELFNFANTYRGKYSNSISDAAQFYSSSNYGDELVWAAAWLYKASGKTNYLTLAESLFTEFGMQNNVPWGFDWDDKTAGAQLLLFQITGKQNYKTNVENFCGYARNDVPRSPKGQVHLMQWGSNRCAANFAFICIQAASSQVSCSLNRAFAQQQVDYMLGSSGRSYVTGFGVNPPVRPHHKAASCPNPPATCDWGTFSSPAPNPHLLQGALVGGPKKADDVFVDDRTDYISNEVTLDYNAGFQGALAGLYTGGVTC